MKTILLVLISINFAFSNGVIKNIVVEETFQFDPVLDLTLLGSGIVLQLTGNYQLQQLNSFRNGPDDLFSWDKSWVGTKNDLAVDWSNYLTYPTIGIGLGYSFYEGFANDKTSYLIQDLTLLTEIITFNSAINLWVRSAGFWPRPRYFHEVGPEKDGGELLGSFYSGHASTAFAVATYYSLAISNRYGVAETWWISSLLGSTATAISWLRVEGGKHYPSDVIVGAGVGTAISALFYWWRAKDSIEVKPDQKVQLIANPQYVGLAFTF